MRPKDSKFHIQVGRYRGEYLTRFALDNENQAVVLYGAINIGRGYKKRLIHNGKVINRNVSSTY